MKNNDEICRTINIKSDGKKYSIRYRLNKNILYFTDKYGGSIAFVKSNSGLSIFVDDKYSEKILEKDFSTLIINSYKLAPEQIKIFVNWYFKGIYKL